MTSYVRAMVGLPSVRKLRPMPCRVPRGLRFSAAESRTRLKAATLPRVNWSPSPEPEESMSHMKSLVVTSLLLGLVAAARPAPAQTILTMSSWVSPQHHLTANVLQVWANDVEKATGGRVKFTMLPKHPSAPPEIGRAHV